METPKHSSTNSEILAKIIRVITVPPVLVLALILILYGTNRNIFNSAWDVTAAIVTLGIIPITAYPLQKILPEFRNKGRDGQRKLAFITNLIGYSLAVVWGVAAKTSKDFLLIVLTYFLAVVILTVFNKFLHIRASGHACSITSPLIMLIYFIGWKSILPCILIAVCVVWASLKLKRHTIKELSMGALTCILSFLAAICITFMFI